MGRSMETATPAARWVLVVGAVLGAVLGGVVGHVLARDGYTSTSQVLVSDARSASVYGRIYNTNQYINQRMSTYTELATSDAVTVPAARRLGVDADDLADRVSASILGGSAVIELSASGATPEEAVAAARALTPAFRVGVTGLETLPGRPPRATTQVLSTPEIPPERALPLVPVAVVGGALGGLLVGALLVRTYHSTRVRNRLARLVHGVAAPADGADAAVGVDGDRAGHPAGRSPDAAGNR